MVAVSVVMPIYNGERYLSQTVGSLLAQDFADFELLCVDDASTDASLDVLTRLVDGDPRVKIHQMEKNLGTAVRCLQRVLPECNGDYFFYCSQDDVLSPDCLRLLVERARATGAEVVLPDMVWWHERTKDSEDRLGPPNGDHELVLSGRDAFVQSLDWTLHGFSLRDMELVRRIGYVGDETNVDEYVTRAVFLEAQRVAFAPGVFYYRQDNAGALTQQFSAKLFDWLRTDLRVLELAREAGLADHVLQERIGAATQASWRMRLLYWLRRRRFASVDDRKRALRQLRRTSADLKALCAEYGVSYNRGLPRLVRAQFRP